MEFCKILPSSSAEALANNSELLTEILLLLPAKPLLTFKCVSKHWLFLISSPHFCHLHTRRHPVAASAIFLRRSQGFSHAEYDFISLVPKPSRPPLSSLSFEEDTVGIKILQSCNGLLLCCSLLKYGGTRTHYIYNPTTNHSFKLPPPNDSDSGTVFGLNLAFQSSKSPYYNVVFVRTMPLSICLCQIEIYSSETRTWRLSGNPFIAPSGMMFNHGIFWNGAIHWLDHSGSSKYFHIEEERMGTMPSLAYREQSGKRYRYFGESGEHLHLIEIYGTQQLNLMSLRWKVITPSGLSSTILI